MLKVVLSRAELPVYLSKVQTRTRTFARLASAVPNWAIAASKVLLVQPSSAASA